MATTYAHENQTYNEFLTGDENAWVRHMMRWGSDGYPVRKLGGKWSFERAFNVGGSPILYRTKKAAFEAVENFSSLLSLKMRGAL